MLHPGVGGARGNCCAERIDDSSWSAAASNVVDTFRQNLPPAVAAGLGKSCPPVRGAAPSRAPRAELQLLDSFCLTRSASGPTLHLCNPSLSGNGASYSRSNHLSLSRLSTVSHDGSAL